MGRRPVGTGLALQRYRCRGRLLAADAQRPPNAVGPQGLVLPPIPRQKRLSAEHDGDRCSSGGRGEFMVEVQADIAQATSSKVDKFMGRGAGLVAQRS